jgi:5-methylcytosine-specific restriction enzyme B
VTFYWQHARANLFTDAAIQLFQIALKHDGESLDTASPAIDAEYQRLIGAQHERHGGNFLTVRKAFEEAGWMYVDASEVLRVTPAGRQAEALLISLPHFLRAVPYFVVELFARFQLNNPANNLERQGLRGREVAEGISKSDVFPYWTLWRIMRGANNHLSTDEWRRFVFTLQRADDIEECVARIKQYRRDRDSGVDRDELDRRYPVPQVAQEDVARTGYVMERAGAKLEGWPPLILDKEGASTFVLNEDYLPFIDAVLANEPIFKDHPTAESWFAEYGAPVDLSVVARAASTTVGTDLPDSDELLETVEELLKGGANAFLLTGPPGTSKSWYARRIALRLVDGAQDRVHLVQFHPSYGYEDFIEGYVPEPSAGGPPQFTLRPKVFMNAASQARAGGRVVVVIDEFSRGDAGRIFGEALTYLESDYRGEPFTLASGRTWDVPNDLIIIATMNPYDRSVTDLDQAMLRRFEEIPLRPSETMLRHLLKRNDMPEALQEHVVAFFRQCQEVLPFGGLGHAYFLRAKDAASLTRIWQYKLEPMVERVLRHEEGKLATIRAASAALLAAASRESAATSGGSVANGTIGATTSSANERDASPAPTPDVSGGQVGTQ